MMKTVEKSKIKSIIGFVIFIVIVVRILVSLTYLMRNSDGGLTEAFYEPVDVVYVGGSAAYMYWEPFRAWNNKGITSVNCCVAGLQAEGIKAFIREIEKHYSPELYIIDVRPFQYYDDEKRIRSIYPEATNLGVLSVNRFELINNVYRNRGYDEKSKMDLYFDLITNHGNYPYLAAESSWDNMRHTLKLKNKGWGTEPVCLPLEQPDNNFTNDYEKLPEQAERTLVDLLTYLDGMNISALFVVCPYLISSEEQKKYNSIAEVISTYDYEFINFNEHYKEMNIDFKQDFCDKSHVNVLGAEKYTDFLGSYIVDKYNIVDRRDDLKYLDWNNKYAEFAIYETERENDTKRFIENMNNTDSILEKMDNSNSLTEWASLAKDERFTLLIVSNGEFNWPRDVSDEKVLTSFWDIKNAGENVIRVFFGDDCDYSNVWDEKNSHEGVIGLREHTPYKIKIEDDTCNVNIDGIDFKIEDDGINIIVFDNYRGIVVRHINLNDYGF